MTLDSAHWFNELNTQDGSAFSLKYMAKLHEEQTPFQKIEVYQTEGFGNLMVIDGFIMLTQRDNFLYHEMMAHPVLFTHPHPQRVLIIGGGDCGTLREVLRHPAIAHVEQVDIDEGVTRVAEQFFPELCQSNHDPRARLHFADGLKWVKEAAPGSYDVIIVDSTDPIGPAEGLFGVNFYRDCLNALGTDGILVHQSESPLLHLKLTTAMRLAMQAAGFADLSTLHFPQPTYPSGWWSCTMARKTGSFTGFREKDAAERPFATRYYSEAIHAAARVLPPFVRQAFGIEAAAAVNV
ncbi:MAG TPA: polyamine aminopropyltransferase [Gammaproteobacteria bacterium]